MFTGSCKTSLILALQIACLIICSDAGPLQNGKKSSYATDGGCNHNFEVDYLDLAVSWGPGACSTNKVNCRDNIKSKFTIHGLWPQRNSHSSPVNCCTKTFYDSRDVKTMKRDLKEHWPTIDYQSDETFWPYEWNKHGSCAVKIKGVSTVPEYFDFTLKAFKRWNMQKILETAGYYPSNSNYYSGQGMADALSRAVGRRISVECAPSKKDPRMLVLTQVHLCYSKSLQLVDCKNTSKKCREKIRFPLTA